MKPKSRDVYDNQDPPEDDDDCDDETGHDYDLSDIDDRPDYDPGDWGQPGDGNYYP